MPRKFHALKAPKARQDWSKWNLYNLQRLTTPSASQKTFFQQKWSAKSLTRAYHNPYVREGQWTRMFDRRLPAVVPMDYKYLAKNDGSEFAAGRGMGLETEELVPERRSGADRRGGAGVVVGAGGRDRRRQRTPYMHMAFHPMERRLDTAIWRALFASSTKQARQFVVHGCVKVNGKKMIYPGYLLNPGDMFSVDPERVMYATGARKFDKNSPKSHQKLAEEGEQDEVEELLDEAEAEDSEAGEATLESAEEREAMATKPDEQRDAKKALRSLMVRARKILDASKTDLSAKRLQELRTFGKTVRTTLSKHGSSKASEDGNVMDTIEDLEASLTQITSKIPAEASASTPAASPTDSATPAPSNPQAGKDDVYRARKDAELLHAALQRARENPVDATKPYATPWRPREFMSAFAFIPRYLEVNQNICSAVYLRHPVARPGLAEVPSPFSAETMGLAFNWYLRRR